VKLADLLGFRGGRHPRIAGAIQHLLEQKDIGLLIVNDQDLALKDVSLANHGT
jgi:hypothetical protein